MTKFTTKISFWIGYAAGLESKLNLPESERLASKEFSKAYTQDDDVTLLASDEQEKQDQTR